MGFSILEHSFCGRIGVDTNHIQEEIPKQIRVLLADDHPVVIEGLQFLLNSQLDIQVVATARNGREAVEKFQLHKPDITVLDLRMPELGGVAALERIRQETPEARVIILTTLTGDEDIHRAFEAGATTYLLKESLSESLVNTVRKVHAGERPIPPEIAALLVSRIALPKLTKREVEVLEWVSKGLRNKEISAVLAISEETVQVHVKNILAKLQVHDRTEAMNVALRRGILHLE